MERKEVAITLLTGFLESGKTTTMMNILRNQAEKIRESKQQETTLIIDMEEEGEIAYDDEFFSRHNMIYVRLDNPFELTEKFLSEMELLYEPDQVFIEYNGMFHVHYLEEMKLPKGWQIKRQMTLADGSCFGLYMRNLKENFHKMVQHADMIVFNRCTADMPLQDYGDIVREVNLAGLIIFEDEGGNVLCTLS